MPTAKVPHRPACPTLIKNTLQDHIRRVGTTSISRRRIEDLRGEGGWTFRRAERVCTGSHVATVATNPAQMTRTRSLSDLDSSPAELKFQRPSSAPSVGGYTKHRANYVKSVNVGASCSRRAESPIKAPIMQCPRRVSHSAARALRRCRYVRPYDA